MKLFEDHRPLVDFLEKETEETRMIHNWSKIEDKQHRRAVFLRSLPLAAAAAAVTALLFGASYYFRDASEVAPNKPLALRNQPMMPVLAVPARTSTQQRVVLSDGSRLTVAPGATLEVLVNTPRLFKTDLQCGWVRFDVVPNRGRSWVIDAGIASIQVVGTQFTVRRTSDSVAVRVHRGVVHVRPIPFKGEIVELAAGAYQEWTSKDGGTEDVSDVSGASGLGDTARPREIENARPRGKKGVSKAAPAAPASVPVSPLAGMGASEAVNDLLDAVDRARKQGQHHQAATLLHSLIKTYPDDPVVGLAALTLARIQLDTLNRPMAAAAAFRFAANAGTLPRSLREQAAARCVEAYHRAGKKDAAKAAHDQYKHLYPGGEWLPMVEKWGADTE